MNKENEIVYDYPKLFDFTQKVFESMGCSETDAHLATDVLLTADLRGIDSHGIARLSGYIRLWEAGRINTKPNIKVVYETPATATIDGDAGLGLVVAARSMDFATEKADKCGTGWVAVRNSNHFGIAAYHAMLALEKDMMGMSMTNASPLVSPTNSAERLLGTNPICLAIPAGEEPSFIADFATSTVSNGKLEILERKNQQAPLGWVADQNGMPTDNPSALRTGGSLLPLGSDDEHGNHKGFCLGAMVDILSAVLSGAGYGPWAPPFVSFLPLPPDPVGEGLGHFLGAWRVDAFRPKEEFFMHMDNWIRRFRNAKPAEGKARVIIPGTPEREAVAERLVSGIPVLKPVYDSLCEVSKKMSVEMPAFK